MLSSHDQHFLCQRYYQFSKILMVLKQILMKTTTNTLNLQQQWPTQPSRGGSGVGGEGRSYSGFNIFKMAVMDAAIFEALWRHTAQIKYTKPNYEGFSRIFCF